MDGAELFYILGMTKKKALEFYYENYYTDMHMLFEDEETVNETI